MLAYQRFTPTIRIGCSGWQYRHWRGNFYPAMLPASRWLRVLRPAFRYRRDQQQFYRLPEASTFATRMTARGPVNFSSLALGPHPRRELTLMLALPPSLADRPRELRWASGRPLATVARSAQVARARMAAGAHARTPTCPTCPTCPTRPSRPSRLSRLSCFTALRISPRGHS
jgi:hypothetical protein